MGSNDPSHKKAEMYNFATETWRRVEDYPFSSGQSFYDFDMIYIDEISSFLVIGGTDGIDSYQIAMFKNGAWFYAGKLNSARHVCFVFCTYF